MPLGALEVAGLVGGGVGLLQTGIGAFSMFGGKKDYERLMRNYPLYKYQEPASYGQAVNVSGQAYAAGVSYYGINGAKNRRNHI
jgi:hypothetical protein